MREFSGELDEERAVPYGAEHASFDELMQMASHDGRRGVDAHQSLLRLLDAVTAGSARDRDELLSRTVRAAIDLTGARHGAVAVVDRHQGRRLLVSHGIADEATLQGRPAGHPTQQGTNGANASHRPAQGPTFLTVPMPVAGRVFGSLQLTGKVDGSTFTERDEQVVTALAVAVGAAIGDAWFHHDAARREHWLAAAAELTSALMEPGTDESCLQIVADRARELAGADLAWVVSAPDSDPLRLRVISGMSVDAEAMAALDFSRSLASCVRTTGRPLTVSSLSQHPRAVDVAQALGAGPAGPAVIVPLRGDTGVEGAVGLAWWPGTDPIGVPRDASLPALFVEHAALALNVARVRRDQQALAILADRDRIARDLHDVVIQRLYAVELDLQGTAWLHDPDQMTRRLDRTIDDLDATIRDIRRTIFGLGSTHDPSDPRARVAEVVERAARTMRLRPTLEFRGPVASLVDDDLLPDVLAVLTEALSNAVRHAEASTCEVEVDVEDGVTVRVTDDGRGLTDSVDEGGLASIRIRAEQRGGHLSITSPNGHGTSLVWSVPRS